MSQPESETTISDTTPCPACGGPPRHPGICTDSEGYVLPAYTALAETWNEQGRPVLTEEELVDLEEMLSADDEDERRA